MDKSVPFFGIIMTQDTPSARPHFGLPEGYAFSPFRPEFILAWARLQTAVGQMDDVPAGVRCFIRDFLFEDSFHAPKDDPGAPEEADPMYLPAFTEAVLAGDDLSAFLAACPAFGTMRRRVLFLTAPDGALAATGALWTGDTFGEMKPLLHWIAADPAYQGKGLGKALLSGLFDIYDKERLSGGVYLITQTWSGRAVRLYQKFGFRIYPGPRPENWRFIEQRQDPAAGYDFEENTRTAVRLIGLSREELTCGS